MSPQDEVTSRRSPIRVLVVDDHDLFRVGLASMLDDAEDVEVVAQGSSARMALRLAAEMTPDVVLLDLRLPDLDGSEVTAEILARAPSVRVVVLTREAGERDIAAALGAGACGYLLKDSSIEDVLAAIRAAARGNVWLSPRAARTLVENLRRVQLQPEEAAEVEDALSPRENDVLQLMTQGLDNIAIAAALHISPRTAKNHVASILSKLGVSNRVQAAVHAVRQGIA
jgi:DNA-binding NarL/FixJ family response regulator